MDHIIKMKRRPKERRHPAKLDSSPPPDEKRPDSKTKDKFEASARASSRRKHAEMNPEFRSLQKLCETQ